MMKEKECRLCLTSLGEITHSNCMFLWTNEEKETRTSEDSVLGKIEEHLCIKLQERQDLSNIICKICVDQLDNWISFKLNCQYNNKYLMGTLFDDSSDIISNEDDSHFYVDYKIDIKKEEIDKSECKNKTIKEQGDRLNVDFAATDSCEDNNFDLVSETDMQIDKIKEPECSKGKDIDHLYSTSMSSESASSEQILELGGKRYKCKDCKKLLNNPRYLKHDCLKDKEKYECPDCPQIFDCLEALDEHLRYHKYPCPVCNKIYSRYYLWEHFPAHLGRSKCKICLRTFQTKASMREHMQVKHTQSNDFVCEECGALFRTKRRLEVHQKSHNKILSYKCDQCEYKTNMQQRLTAHKRRRHTPLDKQPICVCDMCGKSFRQSARLARHVARVHKGRPHECQICGYRTSTKSNLKIHLNGKTSCLERLTARSKVLGVS